MPDEERFERILPNVQVFRYPLRSAVGEIDRSDFSSFSTNREFPGFEIYPASVERGQFGYAESRRIDAFQNREIPFVLNAGSRTRSKYPFDFFGIQKRHVTVATFGEFDHRRIHRCFAATFQKF